MDDLMIGAVDPEESMQAMYGLDRAVERVRRMELLFDALSGALEAGREPAEDAGLREAAATLAAYQSGGGWLQDYELDERGLFPAGLKRGVLSQDGLYELLCRPELEALLNDPDSCKQNKTP